MNQPTIQNNDSWSSIRTKLNNIIGYTNTISKDGEKPSFETIPLDNGKKLTKGSKILFLSSADGKVYQIDVELFYSILSKRL